MDRAISFGPEFHADAVYADLRERIGKRIPGAYMRYGDGEAKVSGCPSHYSGAMLLAELRMQFGTNNFTDIDLAVLRAALNEAVASADWLGVIPEHWPQLWRTSRAVLADIVFARRDKLPRIVDVTFPQWMYDHDQFRDLFDAVDFVGLVGCRDLRDYFAEEYGACNVVYIPVPEQSDASYAGSLSRHFPDFAQTLIEAIHVPYQGALFFVAAGICGKLYCKAIRDKGGIAVDLGSVFDLFAGRFTRPYMNLDRIVTYHQRRRDQGRAVPDTYHALADYHRLQKDLDAEADILAEALRVFPGLFDFRFRTCQNQIARGDAQTAHRDAIAAIPAARFDAGGYYRLAKQFLLAQDHESGRDLLCRGFNTDPGYEPTLLEMTNFFLGTDEHRPTGLNYDFEGVMRVATARTRNYALAAQQARFLGALRSMPDAVDVANRAVQLFSYDAEVFEQKAAWERALQRPWDAEASLRRAEELRAAHFDAEA
jgi:hypothetical protein